MFDIRMTGLEAIQQRFASAAQQLPRLTAQIYQQRLTEAVTYAKQTYLTGGTTAQRLAVRTGALRASFGAQVQQSGGNVSARIGYILPQTTRGGGDPLLYARIHEGWPDHRSRTRIQPRRGQYLAIPLPGAKTPAGVPRGRPRDFPNTFVTRGRQGSLLIMQRVGKGQIEPLFLLVREVIVPARPALRPTMRRYTPLIVEDLGKAIRALLGA